MLARLEGTEAIDDFWPLELSRIRKDFASRPVTLPSGPIYDRIFSYIRSEAAHFLGNGAKHLVHCSLKGQVSPEQEEVILDEYKAWYQDHCQIKTAPYPGIMELLANLKAAGCRMAVVSNKPDPAVRELNATFFGDLLETAIGEKKEIRRKPAPDTLLEAMRLLGADREECVYIGDTEVDLQTAAKFGR